MAFSLVLAAATDSWSDQNGERRETAFWYKITAVQAPEEKDSWAHILSRPGIVHQIILHHTQLVRNTPRTKGPMQGVWASTVGSEELNLELSSSANPDTWSVNFVSYRRLICPFLDLSSVWLHHPWPSLCAIQSRSINTIFSFPSVMKIQWSIAASDSKCARLSMKYRQDVFTLRRCPNSAVYNIPLRRKPILFARIKSASLLDRFCYHVVVAFFRACLSHPPGLTRLRPVSAPNPLVTLQGARQKCVSPSNLPLAQLSTWNWDLRFLNVIRSMWKYRALEDF